ncbi:cathepsin L1 [Galendromus occidentalis]|uniref:Cathepsin L1 n=1 Tax=Galendromus occidentalis TaxID=34638 RepID=A0AAJ7PA23_9ACAR|nr:cathepsin L1 [Galendromus occidentalis]
MRLYIASVLALVVAVGADLTNFEHFKEHFGKTYEGDEHALRQGIFQRNLAHIEKFNAEKAASRGYTLGITQFADMSTAEFRQTYLGLRMNASTIAKLRKLQREVVADDRDLPEAVDWRDKGAVSPVKDQGQCGSCWAFSTSGAIEGQHFLKNGELLSLSEQQMVDCSWLDFGCNGGQPMLAMEYVRFNGGLELETAYPYKGVGGSCHSDKKSAAAKITGFWMAGFYSESALQKAVAKVGPISVGMDASGEDFQHYKSGIYNPESCSSIGLDHAVLAVGYGTSDDGDYWLVKNSWNTSWGEKGYFKLPRNKGNKCGIATTPIYPTV